MVVKAGHCSSITRVGNKEKAMSFSKFSLGTSIQPQGGISHAMWVTHSKVIPVILPNTFTK